MGDSVDSAKAESTVEGEGGNFSPSSRSAGLAFASNGPFQVVPPLQLPAHSCQQPSDAAYTRRPLSYVYRH